MCSLSPRLVEALGPSTSSFCKLNQVVKIPGSTLDYWWTWDSWKNSRSGEIMMLSPLAISSADVLMWEATTEEMKKTFNGYLSDHNPILLSFVPFRQTDPSMIVVIVLLVLACIATGALILYRFFGIKHENRLPTEADMAKATKLDVYYRQSIILIVKNFTVLKRSRRSLITQILVPFVFVALLRLLQIAINVRA